MKLKCLHLKNVCQHRDLEVEFADGLNCILGPNGAGKSNLLKSAYAALTNDFSRFHGNKADQISQFAKGKSISYIEAWYQHGPTNLHIFRGLRPASKYLQINDGERITNENAITNAIEEILGVSNKILADYVFVDQFQLFAFLSQIHSARAKAMSRLFGTEKAEVCYKLLGETISKLSIPITITDIDTARRRYAENKAELAKLNRRLLQIQMTTFELESKSYYENIVKVYATNEKLRDEKIKLENAIKVLIDKDTKIGAELNELYSKRDELSKLNEAQSEQYNTAKEVLKYKKQSNVISTTKDKLLKKIQKLEFEIKSLVKPEKPINCLDEHYCFHTATKDLTTINVDINRLREQIKRYKIDGKKECIECGTPVDEFCESLQEKEQRLEGLEKIYETGESRLNISKAYWQSQIAYDNDLKDYTDALTRFNEELNNIIEVEEASDISKHTDIDLNVIKEVDDRTREILKLRKEYDTLFEQLTYKQGELSQLDARLAALTKQLQTTEVSEDEVKEAKKSINIIEQSKAQAQRCKLQIAGLSAIVKHDRELLQEAEKVLIKAKKVKAAVSQLEEIRNILHRDALPSIISQYYLESICGDINEVLDSFASPFRVISGDNLSFRVLFHDGRDIPAEALSGGESSIFAIAFRVAINSRFANDIGLLCLDEPTASLDKENIGCLTIALDKLKQFSRSTGLQCILITHVNSLTPSFDKVIEL